jgi:uracil phosphoribosyltransferase
MCVACARTDNDAGHKVEKPNVGLSQNSPIVLNHPLIAHYLSIIRNKNTKADEFREYLKRISNILILEATKNLPTVAVNIETPLKKTTCQCIDPSKRIFIVSILRAGLGITSVAEDMIPGAVIQHIGMYRDEKTHKPVRYYNRLPTTFTNPSVIRVLICDPMLATGGSASEAIKLYLEKGIKEENIIFVCVIGAPEGVKKLLEAFPKIKIIMASLDEKLNEKAFIIPGLGDAGDRFFNTMTPD